MKIKIANTEQEKDHTFQIRTTVFIHEQNVPPEEEIDAFDKEAIHFIGYNDNAPVAASRLRFVEEYGKLERICVLKDQRGKGYGKQLIEAMETEILKKGYTKAKLNAQTHATGFYEQLGYKVISEEFIDAGIPHVTMVHDLK
ncbi:MAG TPA: GNAT family N-acetyltransferase [Candidatus Avamphibacillus sp.]|nr:GNAT family N-acetyltransferase [Candidatus Avamphibacillus sp.]